MSDIKKFAVEETSLLSLRGPDDAPLLDDAGQPMTVTVYGPGSKTYARAQAVMTNHLVDRLKRKGKTAQNGEDTRREQAEFLAACTKAFSANVEYEGLAGDALIKAVYSDPTIGFIAEQVAKHIGEWANFSKASTTS